MTKTADIDWLKAERFYRAGVISVEAIAQKCGCTRPAVYLKAKENGWKRDLAPKIRKLVKRKLDTRKIDKKPDCKVSPQPTPTERPEPTKDSEPPHNVSAPLDSADVHAREKEDEALVEAAARELVEVTQVHRVEAARLIGIARDLGGKLVDLIQGRAVAFEAKTKDGSRVLVPFLGEHESAADALGKVTRALKHLVDIERKAFGMDAVEDNPDENRRDFVPLEERLATYRREAEQEKAMAEAGNVVDFSPPD